MAGRRGVIGSLFYHFTHPFAKAWIYSIIDFCQMRLERNHSLKIDSLHNRGVPKHIGIGRGKPRLKETESPYRIMWDYDMMSTSILLESLVDGTFKQTTRSPYQFLKPLPQQNIPITSIVSREQARDFVVERFAKTVTSLQDTVDNNSLPKEVSAIVKILTDIKTEGIALQGVVEIISKHFSARRS